MHSRSEATRITQLFAYVSDSLSRLVGSSRGGLRLRRTSMHNARQQKSWRIFAYVIAAPYRVRSFRRRTLGSADRSSPPWPNIKCTASSAPCPSRKSLILFDVPSPVSPRLVNYPPGLLCARPNNRRTDDITFSDGEENRRGGGGARRDERKEAGEKNRNFTKGRFIFRSKGQRHSARKIKPFGEPARPRKQRRYIHGERSPPVYVS